MPEDQEKVPQFSLCGLRTQRVGGFIQYKYEGLSIKGTGNDANVSLGVLVKIHRQ
jgi:hypothetical protein